MGNASDKEQPAVVDSEQVDAPNIATIIDILRELLKIKSSDKYKISQECKGLYYWNFLLTIYSVTVSQTITTRDFAESGRHLTSSVHWLLRKESYWKKKRKEKGKGNRETGKT